MVRWRSDLVGVPVCRQRTSTADVKMSAVNYTLTGVRTNVKDYLRTRLRKGDRRGRLPKAPYIRDQKQKVKNKN